MSKQRNVDRMLDRWMDDGPTVVADRVIAAAMTDVHTTRQIGAPWAPLKEFFMTMKPAATLLALAIVGAVGVAAYQLIWAGGNLGGPSEPRIIAASELPHIVMNEEETPPGMNLDGIYTERDDVLLRPVVSVAGADAAPYTQQPGFLAGRYTEFSDEQAGVLSWAALFATPEDADRALEVYAEEVQSDAGHGLASAADVELGDEGAFYSDGSDPAFNAQVYLWRLGNLVMAAATYGDFDPDQLGKLAEGMDDRAR